jgi:hypothetical protein
LIPVATQSTVPNLTLSQDARLFKYVRLPSGRKYLRADYSEGFGVKPHAVFLPKSKTATVVEGGRHVASDGGANASYQAAQVKRRRKAPSAAWRPLYSLILATIAA